MPVHLIITMIKWTRTGRLTIKNSLSTHYGGGVEVGTYKTRSGEWFIAAKCNAEKRLQNRENLY